MPEPKHDGEKAPLENELAELRAREQRALGLADAASRARDAFLSKLSHDLRNPLGAIAAANEVLSRIGGQQPDEVRARDVIRRQLQQLTRLVDDLLDASRVINGAVTLSRARVDLAQAVQQAIDALATTGRAGDHRIDAELSPAWIDADRARIEQVASQLLANAARFSPAGSTIAVRVAVDGNDATLVVADEGVGIAPEHLARLFEPFARDRRESVQRRAGFGVGLALAKRIAEAHGGSVRASSEGLDRGSRFEVRLPRTEPPTALAPQEPGLPP